MPRLIDHKARREAIAEAVWRVVGREGVAGVSVRVIAAEAGVSTGSLRHLFVSQQQLLVFALRLVIERVSKRVAELPRRSTARKTVEEVAVELLPLDEDRRSEMEVYLALFTAANTASELRTERDAAHRQLRNGCRWMLGQLDNGTDLAPGTDMELETLRLHALIDGLAAHLIYEPSDHDPVWARRALSRHFDSLAAKDAA